jgi:hypothetical protein
MLGGLSAIAEATGDAHANTRVNIFRYIQNKYIYHLELIECI